MQCQDHCSHPLPPAPSTCCPSCEACLYRSKIYAQDERIPTTDPCSDCYCNNGSLVCNTKSCSDVYCANARIPPGKCCPTCPQCNYMGETFEDGSEWTSRSDPCVRCQCHGGTVECHDRKDSCNPQCSHPAKPPGQCCPMCDNCLYFDQEYTNGMTFRSPRHESDCYECACKNGNVQCYKKHCPALNCVVTVLVTTECCPKCLDHPVSATTQIPPQAAKTNPPLVGNPSIHEYFSFLPTAVPTIYSTNASPHIPPSSSLCESCRHTSCLIEGINYEIDESFVHPNNPCQQCTCLESGITCSQVLCPGTPCTHPARPADACCSTCQDCYFTQMIYPNGTSFIHEDDPCQKCSCKDGNVMCETIRCPKLECPDPKPMDGVCCPICFQPKKCRFLDRFYNYHEIFTHPQDHCQECSCTEGVVTCKDRPCPPYACPSPRLKDCCYDCYGCSYAEKNIENYASFLDPLDMCRTCSCINGRVNCYRVSCPAVECLHPVTPPDSCCPVCQECEYEDELYFDGETFEAFYDPCTECRCDYPDITCYPRYCPTPVCTYPSPDANGCCQMCYNCLFEGELYHNGQHFPDPTDPCSQCSCRMGEIQCTAIPCDRPRCPYPVPGKCCPECGSGCQYGDVLIPDGGMFPAAMAECRDCICHAGFVTCVPLKCPSVFCTHPSTVGCCPHCEDCLFEGREIEDGMVFSHPGKPCEECRCSTGSVTCNPLKCPEAPCTHPRIVNCCPSCSVGCRYHDTLLEEGETIFSPSDPCHTCLCKRGSMKCARRTCPSLSCPIESQIQGECCPQCPVSHCFYEDKIYPHDARFTDPHTCRDCICQEGRVECSVLLCPELSCPNQVKPNGSCCPTCDQSCIYNKVHYTPGETFTPMDRPCQICKCEEGEVICDNLLCGLPNCTHPVPADLNECCPFNCNGCSFEGKTFVEGQTFNHSCSSCHCQKGNITCSQLKCPELKCDVPIVPEGEECCATCPSCYHMGITLPPEYRFIDPDQPCSLCVCHNGEVTCFQETCPPEDCKLGEVFQKLQDEDCCPVCMNPLNIIHSNVDETYDEAGTEGIRYYEHQQKKEERILLQVEKETGTISTFVYNYDISKENSSHTFGKEVSSIIDVEHKEGRLKEIQKNISFAPEEHHMVEPSQAEFHAKDLGIYGLYNISSSDFLPLNMSEQFDTDGAAITPEESTVTTLPLTQTSEESTSTTSTLAQTPEESTVTTSTLAQALEDSTVTTTLAPVPVEHNVNRTLGSSENLKEKSLVESRKLNHHELAEKINLKLKNLAFNVALPSQKEQLKFNVKIKVSKRLNDSDIDIPTEDTQRKCHHQIPFNVTKISESEETTDLNATSDASLNLTKNDTELPSSELYNNTRTTNFSPTALSLSDIDIENGTLKITSDDTYSAPGYAFLEREKELLEHRVANSMNSNFQNESDNMDFEENREMTTSRPLNLTSTTEASKSQLESIFPTHTSRSLAFPIYEPDLPDSSKISEAPKADNSSPIVDHFNASIANTATPEYSGINEFSNEKHTTSIPYYTATHHPQTVTQEKESEMDDIHSTSASPVTEQSYNLSSAGIMSTESTFQLTSPFPPLESENYTSEGLLPTKKLNKDSPIFVVPSVKEDSPGDSEISSMSKDSVEETVSPKNTSSVSMPPSETLQSKFSVSSDIEDTIEFPATDSPDSFHSKSQMVYSTPLEANGEPNLGSSEKYPNNTTVMLTGASSNLDAVTHTPMRLFDSSLTTEKELTKISNLTSLQPISVTKMSITASPTSNVTSSYLSLEGKCDEEEVGKSINFPDDPCTNCTCNSSLHWECSQVWCPPLDCPIEELYLHEGECCPICKACEVSIGSELHQYGEGESWSDPKKPCLVCVCRNGRAHCSASHCGSPPPIYSLIDCLGVVCPELKCTESQEERQIPGACCPICGPASQRCVWWGRHIRTFDGLLLHHHAKCAYTFLQHCPETLFTIYTKFGDSEEGLAVIMVTVVVGEDKIELGKDSDVTVNEVKELLPYVTSTTAVYSHGHNVVVITDKGLQVVWHSRGQVEVIVGGEHMGKTCGLCGNLNNHPQDDFGLPSGLQSTNIGAFLESWSIGEKCRDPEPQNFCSKSAPSSDVHSYEYVNRSCSILKGPSFQECHRVVPPDPYIDACITEVCGCQEDKGSSCLCNSLHLYSTLCVRSGIILNWRTSYLCEPTCPQGMVWSECVPACGPPLCGPPTVSKTVKHESFASFLSGISSHPVSPVDNKPVQKCPGPCVPGCTCPQGYALLNAECVPVIECS
ncbi:uncharacterized protein [Palaemon carinicauda]|uniref:uncharacterized protein n=1 Tax=Palaemon carinicauda TaxID=392227 RepID=UPI0035B5B71A